MCARVFLHAHRVFFCNSRQQSVHELKLKMQFIVFFLNNSVQVLRQNKTLCTVGKAAKENCKHLLSSDESLLNKSLNNHF